ncbi:MAG: hypothetical protein PHU71_00270 [Candidatus Gracilibacteria bacterium]|nr:hypothetical protein [Candidatus Gracilibacteria bacterium]
MTTLLCIAIFVVFVVERTMAARFAAKKAGLDSIRGLIPDPNDRALQEKKDKATLSTGLAVIRFLRVGLLVCGFILLNKLDLGILPGMKSVAKGVWPWIRLMIMKAFFASFVISFFCMLFFKRGSKRKWAMAICASTLGAYIFFGYCIPTGFDDAHAKGTVTLEKSKDATDNAVSAYRSSSAATDGCAVNSADGIARAIARVIEAHGQALDGEVQNTALANLRALDARAQRYITDLYKAKKWQGLAYSDAVGRLYRELARARDLTEDAAGSLAAARMLQQIEIRASFSNLGRDWAEIKPDWADPDPAVAFTPP